MPTGTCTVLEPTTPHWLMAFDRNGIGRRERLRLVNSFTRAQRRHHRMEATKETAQHISVACTHRSFDFCVIILHIGCRHFHSSIRFFVPSRSSYSWNGPFSRFCIFYIFIVEHTSHWSHTLARSHHSSSPTTTGIKWKCHRVTGDRMMVRIAQAIIQYFMVFTHACLYPLWLCDAFCVNVSAPSPFVDAIYEDFYISCIERMKICTKKNKF